MAHNQPHNKQQLDDEGRTALHYSAIVRQHDLLSLLLSHGADQTIADRQGGRVALHLSALALDDAAIALLLSSPNAKSVIDVRDDQGRTAAFLAAVLGRYVPTLPTYPLLA